MGLCCGPALSVCRALEKYRALPNGRSTERHALSLSSRVFSYKGCIFPYTGTRAALARAIKPPIIHLGLFAVGIKDGSQSSPVGSERGRGSAPMPGKTRGEKPERGSAPSSLLCIGLQNSASPKQSFSEGSCDFRCLLQEVVWMQGWYILRNTSPASIIPHLFLIFFFLLIAFFIWNRFLTDNLDRYNNISLAFYSNNS